MNYLWDLIIRAQQNKISRNELTFKVAKIYSPYMEISRDAINDLRIGKEIELNPYYRFYEIFKELFLPEQEDENIEFRETFFDIIIHIIAEADLRQGMTTEEYYLEFIKRDIEKGLLGKKLQENFEILTPEESIKLREILMNFYKSRDVIKALRDSSKQLFKFCRIYEAIERNEMIFYIGEKESLVGTKKLEIIENLFLPLGFRTNVYWNRHFGIIGEHDTMKIDELIIY